MLKTLITVLLLLIAGCAECPKYDSPQRLTWTQEKIARYFIKKQVVNPVECARAIATNSEYPFIAAAQAVVESQVKPAAVGKHKERGCYQVREKYWGKVSTRLDRQTRQHSVILAALIQEHRGHVKRAIRAYNGSGRKAIRYERMVAKNIAEVMYG